MFSALLSKILLLRSRGVRPRLFRISALFIQNSSMISALLDGVSSEEESDDRKDSDLSAAVAGVEASAGMGWVLTGDPALSGDDGSWQDSG